MRTAVTLAAAARVAGCLSTDPSPGLELHIRVGAQTVSPNAPVDITVVGINRLPKLVSTPDPRSYCAPPAYEIRDASGNVVSPAPHSCTLAQFAPLNLAPGDSVVIPDQLDGRGIVTGA